MLGSSLNQRFSRMAILSLVLALANRAHAIGWDSNDFLIGGGPSFTTRIGVFDHDLSFKGYLDSNFITVAGMDFDAAGQLVAVASGNVRSVRVYESGGSIVGGFTRPDNLLGLAADLKVAPDGSYVIATQSTGGGDGARKFAPDGTFIRQYGTGDINGVAVVPGNRVWICGEGPGIGVYDLPSGGLIETHSIPGDQFPFTMRYNSVSNTVLIVDIPVGAVFEVDLSGTFLRRFDAPVGASSLQNVTRGLNGDVFATTSNSTVLRWTSDGSFAGSTAMPAGFNVYNIVWAGNAPEPSGVATILFLTGQGLRRRPTSARSAQN